jgi:hypothetical protein
VVWALFSLRKQGVRRELEADPEQPENARRWRFAALAALVPLAVFVAFSIAHVPKVNWTGPLWLALLPASAALFARGQESPEAALGGAQRLAAPSLWIALVGYGLGLHALALGLPGSKFPANTRYAQHWGARALAVDRAVKALRERSGESPVVVGFDRYATASLLGFYQPENGPRWRIGGPNLLGAGPSLMFDYWTPAESLAGTTLLCVSDDPRDLDEISARYAGRLGEIESSEVLAERVLGTRFYFRTLYGYVPDGDSGTNRKNAAASRTADSGASSSHMLPSSRMPSEARWSSPSSSGLAALALPSDSTSFGTHSGRGSPLVSNASALQSGPSLNTHITPAPRSSAEGTVNIDARPLTPSSSSSKSPSTSG